MSLAVLRSSFLFVLYNFLLFFMFVFSGLPLFKFFAPAVLGCNQYFAAIAEKKDMSLCYDSVFHLLCLAHLGVDLPCVVGILFGILCCSYVFLCGTSFLLRSCSA